MSDKTAAKNHKANIRAIGRRLEASPEPLQIDLKTTALLVIDMQNAFVKRDGMFDLLGLDIKKARKIINPIKKLVEGSRKKEIKIIYIAHRYSEDLRESGGPSSGRWYKNDMPKIYRDHPDWREKLIIRGTWGSDIIDELKPQQTDIVVEKSTFSAFFCTNLDIILKTSGIKYLICVGTATNICVEATIRDAFYLGYFPILVADASANEGPIITQKATILNIMYVYGWVTYSENIMDLIKI